ncbi:carbohydrate-binding module family 21 protein [Suillus clintonianus]|uniref:carbohydrate-binding module family 21 protein n=1 Tax=Suillus clintonianus TaxID=1904413 RepID=UPI001B861860|nr:carbohydrate-binding module family 21 protein [Suillus clintonianus]KAG2140194.1 carbohydrate-binding module family 21 protein [Suillus clintonianus]
MTCAAAPDVYRLRSAAPTFSNERGPGAFASLGSLPRRKSHSPSFPHGRKSPAFHIHGTDDPDDRYLSSSDSPDEQTTLTDPPQKFSQGALQLHPSVPFPRRSPSPPSLTPLSSPSITSPRTQSRASSTARILPNGKPLKSSLKSSSSTLSTLSIPSPPLELQRNSNHLHLRSKSEPSTPTSHAPKNVHFPDTDVGLASIRIFSRSARPTAVSTPENPNGDETETEGEDQPSNGFPFPKFPSQNPNFEMDTANSSVVPVTNHPSHANVLIESLHFSHASSNGVNPHLSGTLLVRNLAYEKHVAVRFTLDEWQTVSEVRAQFVASVPSLPSAFSLSASSKTTVGDLVALDANNTGWDRFSFMIRLEDYAHSLGSRVLWLAARYRLHSTHVVSSTEVSGPGGEWWDNNNGGNYRVAFRTARPTPNRVRRDTAPESTVPSMATIPTSRDQHAPGSFVPQFSSSPTLAFGHDMTFLSSPTRDGKEKVLLPSRSGKLRLPNYAAPPVVSPVSPTSSATSVPAQRSNSPPSLSSSTQRPALQVPVSQSHDYDSPSPASSTLSTPSASPNIVPRVMIGGHPANYARPEQSHIDDWEWMAPPTRAVMSKRPSVQRSVTDGPAGLSGSGVPGLPARAKSSSGPPGSDGLSGDSLYNAFVTRWCFAQGTPTAGASPYHGSPSGGDEGILA